MMITLLYKGERKSMRHSLFPWQHNVWRQLQKMHAHLPHAILFYGAQGIGKTIFAKLFAQSLLCEQPQAEGSACGTCSSCSWFMQYNHPDYRLIQPEILYDRDAGDDHSTEDSETDNDKKTTKSVKTPSKEIKIHQIRALSNFINISTHRHGQRVILLSPTEALNSVASNALLKTLEEPPSNTIFLLSTNRLDRLLPTILSRCFKFPMPLPSPNQAIAWLHQQNVKDADIWLAEQGGAPLTAYVQSQRYSQSGGRVAFDEFLLHLSNPSIESAIQCAEHFQKTQLFNLIIWQQRWLYDLFSFKLCGTIRYHPRHEKILATLASKVKTSVLLQALKNSNERRKIAEHPISAHLFIEEMLFEYSAMFT